jgi:outer membrane lipoprotein LolB
MYYLNFLRCNTSRYAIHILCFITVFTGGCVNQPLRQQSERMGLWETHRKSVSALEEWELGGRMAVRFKTESWSASLIWKQKGDEFDIRIIAPLAQGTALLTGNSNKVNLKTSDNIEYSDNDVLLVMRRNLGWDIPVDSLKYWIRGIVRPGGSPTITEIDEYGRLSIINEGDWSVNFQRYNLTMETALPSRIELSRPGTQISVIINRWNVKT